MLTLLILAVILYAGFISAYMYVFLRQRDRRIAHKRFFTALSKILDEKTEEKSIGQTIDEIHLNFKKLAEYNGYISREIRTPQDLIETFVHLVDTGREDYLKNMGVENPSAVRERALRILGAMQVISPFSRLAPEEANTMSALDQAVQTNDVVPSKNLLHQLAGKFELSYASARKLENEKRIATMVSVIGVVLTTVFGIMGVVPLLLRP